MKASERSSVATRTSTGAWDDDQASRSVRPLHFCRSLALVAPQARSDCPCPARLGRPSRAMAAVVWVRVRTPGCLSMDVGISGRAVGMGRLCSPAREHHALLDPLSFDVCDGDDLEGASLRRREGERSNKNRRPVRPASRWSGRRDSNPRHPAWQADALPTDYSRSGRCSNKRPGCQASLAESFQSLAMVRSGRSRRRSTWSRS